MKQTATTIIRFTLLGVIAVLLFFLFKPLNYPLPDLEPLEKKDNQSITQEDLLLPEPEKEAESQVAMLFGWVAPVRTMAPIIYSGPSPTPTPTVAMWLQVTRGTQVDDNVTSYWIKNVRQGGGFWLPDDSSISEGYRYIRKTSDGILVEYENTKMIIRNE